MTITNTLIIGASAAGLATAACLQKTGLAYIILEKEREIANSWKNHYDRLHLHTSKKWSALPYKSFDRSIPQYPSRLQVIDYLSKYAREQDIKPVFNCEVLEVKRSGDKWIIKTSNGDYQSKFVVMATGLNHDPVIPTFKGLETFNGTVLHSSTYKNGSAYSGKNVLVVGFGNSACEQAICLHEHGAYPSMAVRSAVNVLPRDIFGIPILEMGKLTSKLPSKLADMINAPLIRMLIGDITTLGLKKSKYGPREQIEKQHRIPLLDIGTIDLIKQGEIKIYGDILQIQGSRIFFENGKQADFDVIILATGYRHHLKNILQLSDERIGDLTRSNQKQSYFGKEGLYSCGFFLAPTGMLREIAIEARRIAADIAGKAKLHGD